MSDLLEIGKMSRKQARLAPVANRVASPDWRQWEPIGEWLDGKRS